MASEHSEHHVAGAAGRNEDVQEKEEVTHSVAGPAPVKSKAKVYPRAYAVQKLVHRKKKDPRAPKRPLSAWVTSRIIYFLMAFVWWVITQSNLTQTVVFFLILV